MFFCCFNQNKNRSENNSSENILQYANNVIVSLPFFDQTTETARYFFQVNTLKRDAQYEILIYALPRRSAFIRITTDLSRNSDMFSLRDRGELQNYIFTSQNINIVDTNMSKEQIDEFNNYIISEYCSEGNATPEPKEKRRTWWCVCK